jgi:hypothetical protein
MVKGLGVLVMLLPFLFPGIVSAASCTCACVDGEVVPICELHAESNPICPDTECLGSSSMIQEMLLPPSLTVDYLYCQEEIAWNELQKSLI